MATGDETVACLFTRQIMQKSKMWADGWLSVCAGRAKGMVLFDEHREEIACEYAVKCSWRDRCCIIGEYLVDVSPAPGEEVAPKPRKIKEKSAKPSLLHEKATAVSTMYNDDREGLLPPAKKQAARFHLQGASDEEATPVGFASFKHLFAVEPAVAPTYSAGPLPAMFSATVTLPSDDAGPPFTSVALNPQCAALPGGFHPICETPAQDPVLPPRKSESEEADNPFDIDIEC
ncbi:hypothetical protein DIPPA_01522 [Diplonema papillatum]|nr:hypothetical protein DIPPA_01522 [Diplonema papillatum]